MVAGRGSGIQSVLFCFGFGFWLGVGEMAVPLADGITEQRGKDS